MTNEELSQKILEKINQEKITPKPKWTFLLKDYFFWILGISSLLIGALATSVIVYILVNSNWDLIKHSSQSLSKYVFLSIPYLWVICFLIFIFSAYFNLKNTKKGYRYALATIIIFTFLFSVLMGTIFYGLGLGHFINKTLTRNIPPYQKLIMKKEKGFNQPERGLILGTIIGTPDKNHCEILDLEGDNWIINFDKNQPLLENILKEGNQVKIIGTPIDKNIFEACVISPHALRGNGFTDYHLTPSERNILRMRIKECEEDIFFPTQLHQPLFKK
jgi:hypothetical protein